MKSLVLSHKINMYKDIEFVCTGNNGRSPIAEAVAYQVLTNLGLQNRVRVSSSGTLFSLMSSIDEETLLKSLEKHLEDAIKIGLVKPCIRKTETPRALLGFLVDYEETLRNGYLNEAGLTLSNHERKQTIIRLDAQLILPVDRQNLEKVQAIYKGAKTQPIIATLPDFSEVDVDLSEDKWIKTYSEFVKTAEQVHAATRVAILKALEYL